MRKYLLFIIIISTTGQIFLSRIFYLQIVDKTFTGRSENKAIKIEYDYPQGGYIFDRNGEVLGDKSAFLRRDGDPAGSQAF